MAEYAVKELIEKHIIDRMNAAAAWGGAIASGIRSADAVTNARRQAAMEIVGAIARNPQHGFFGDLAALVDVAHNAFVPAHDGDIGIPQITPFNGATARDGLVAKSIQIDSWRDNPASYTGVLDGVSVPHDEADEDGRRSPLSCRWSIEAGLFKFTGVSAKIPMIIITETMSDDKVPLGLSSAVVKLAIPKLVKPGDKLYLIAAADARDGRDDLLSIQEGAMVARPPRSIPDIAMAQKLAT